MTKEQATKHGTVIRWFTKNSEKGVWVKHLPRYEGDDTTSDWILTHEPLFSDTNKAYVQNDEYAELRKAQADG